MARTENEEQSLALDLFMRSLEQPTATREQWLETKIGDDSSLRSAINRLKSADEHLGDFLIEKIQTNSEAIGQAIGHWQIISKIATGGMAHVYLVERNDDEFNQRGALKIIRHQYLNTDLHSELLRRFHIERQILANINHRNVAAILDGGSTDDGLPYLVMEYVEGVSIDAYIEQQNLTLRDTLRLFQRLLSALSLVHANLVVHRDIKPSNILVDTSGELKLLDFGIAKVLEPQQGSEQTAPAAAAMTPDYASPEQVLGEPITVATDIYALGLLLYRLLSGTPAYTVRALPAAEAQKLVCTTDPMPPSKVVNREFTRIQSKELSGDLDAIVMKAVRKDSEKRYGSALEFDHDIARFLEGRPVLAHRDSFNYRAGKFWQRNRFLITSATAIVLVLVMGMGVAIWQAGEARKSALIAQVEAEKANAVTDFLQEIMSQADPYEANGNPTVRQVLENADKSIGDRFVDNPEVEAAVRRTLGWTQLNLGQVEGATNNLEIAHAMNLDFYGLTNDNTLRSLTDLGWLAHEANNHKLAKFRYSQAIANFSEDNAVILRATIHNDFGVVLNYLGEVGSSSEQYSHALRLWETITPDTKGYDLGSTIGNLAANYHTEGKLDVAEDYYLRHLNMLESGEDPSRTNLFYALNNYSALLRETQRRSESLTMLERATLLREEILGAEHPTVARAHNSLTLLYIELGELDKARTSRAIADHIVKLLPLDHDTALRARVATSMLSAAEGREEEAVQSINQLIKYLEELNDNKYLEVKAQAKLHAGALLAKQGNKQKALELVDQAIVHRQTHYGADHYLTEQARVKRQFIVEKNNTSN